jgi:hypothetical protein
MVTEVDKSVYPLSTPEGQSIPMDVMEPLSMSYYTFVANTSKNIVIPAAYSMVALYATKDCILKFGGTALPNTLVDGAEYVNALYIPAQTIITSLIPSSGAASVVSVSAGILTITALENWKMLKQSYQLNQG